MPRFADFDEFDAVDADGFGQTEDVCYDLTSYLANLPTQGVTLQGTPQVEIVLISGTDPSPASRILGTAQIGTSPREGAAANSAFIVPIGNFPGCAEYKLKVWCSRSDGRVATAWNYVRSRIV